ncbi:hypothetical protein F5880DRAFT_1616212 [Lentinula raphanica]|nr:hypothetical protein F5880DRAFT_1616212 [Lentinula raphanica]
MIFLRPTSMMSFAVLGIISTRALPVPDDTSPSTISPQTLPASQVQEEDCLICRRTGQDDPASWGSPPIWSTYSPQPGDKPLIQSNPNPYITRPPPVRFPTQPYR